MLRHVVRIQTILLLGVRPPFSPDATMTNSITRAPDTREEGATAVEYSLMAALIAGVIFAAVVGLGQLVLALFSSVPPF